MTSWGNEKVPQVLKIVCENTRLHHRELVYLLLVSKPVNHALVSCPSIWRELSFRETSNAGKRLVHALSTHRYQSVKHIDLEFARDIEDKDLVLLKEKCSDALKSLDSLNLNVCQKISDIGIEAITCCCAQLKVFSIYWNVRVTDTGIMHLVKNCKHIVDLNLSGCKNISDRGLQLLADYYLGLQSLNLTRCIKLTDEGLKHLMLNCLSLQSLNLYALSSLTDSVYKEISHLEHLKYLDLCGAQNLSDEGLFSIAKCKELVYLNLTWCVRVTDMGIIAVARSCTSLQLVSLFGITGVTDKCLEALSKSCSDTLEILDVNGCIGIKKRSRGELTKMFPRVREFKVHS